MITNNMNHLGKVVLYQLSYSRLEVMWRIIRSVWLVSTEVEIFFISGWIIDTFKIIVEADIQGICLTKY